MPEAKPVKKPTAAPEKGTAWAYLNLLEMAGQPEKVNYVTAPWALPIRSKSS